jgi:predicted permease
MTSLWNNIRFAVRSLRKAPGFTLIVLFVLAVGLGANVAMFSIMSGTLFEPLPYPEPDRLVLGRATFSGNINPQASAQDYWDYRDQSRSFESLGAVLGFTRSYTVTGGETPERVTGSLVSVNLFPTLGISPQIGRPFSADEGLEGGPNVALISHGYWQRRFGAERSAAGQSIIIDGDSYTVIGVLPAGFRFLYDVDVWFPMQPGRDWTGARRWHNWLVVGRLAPGVTVQQAQSEVDVISARLEAEYPDSNANKALLLTELHEALVEGSRAGLLMLMGAVGLVLLIVCGNVASLMLARGTARRGEMAVRSALGASSRTLTRQLLTESLVLAVPAGVLGTLLAIWWRGLFVNLVDTNAAGAVTPPLSATVLGFALVVTVASGVLAGIVPALRAGREDLASEMKSGPRLTDSGGARLRSGLVVAQVAISVVLLICAGLLMRTLASLQGVDPGFNPDRLLTAEIRLPLAEYGEPERVFQFYTSLAENVRAIPGVRSVGLINQLPIRDPGNNIYVYAADNPPTDPSQSQVAFQRVILPGYFEAMEIPLVAGRGIQESDRSGSTPALVINQVMADSLFPGRDPIGGQVVVDVGELVTFDVVGVVRNVHLTALDANPRLAMYGSYFQRPRLTMRLAIRTLGEPESVVGQLRDAVWSQDRNIPLADVASMDDVLSGSLFGYRTLMTSLGAFAGLALLLASMGLYGVLAYNVARRFHEIGIRVALGASGSRIVRLVVSHGVGLAIAGIAVGLLGAFGVTRFLESFLFGIEALDPATFVIVSLFFALVSILASLLPARRALRVDPLIALQTD